MEFRPLETHAGGPVFAGHQRRGYLEVRQSRRVIGAPPQPHLDVGSVHVGRLADALEQDVGCGVIAQILADARQLVDLANTHLLKMALRTDAGQQQDLGRPDGAAAQDDLVSFDVEDLAAALNLYSHGPFPVEQHPVGGDVAPHGDVQAVAGLAQVGEGGAHPYPVDVVKGPGRDGRVALRIVLVPVLRDTQGQAGIIESPVERQPLFPLVAAHRQRPLIAVEVAAGKVPVVFHLAEITQDVGESPLVVAP